MTVTVNFFDQRPFTDFKKVQHSIEPEIKPEVEVKQTEVQPVKKSKKRIIKK